MKVESKNILSKIALWLGFVATFLVPQIALAAWGLEDTAKKAGLPLDIKGATSIPELVGVAVAAVLGLFGIIFFLLIFYAGFNWMTAQGNAEKIDQSKNTIQGAAIGLIVVLAAYAITNFVFTSLGTGNTNVSVTPDQFCAPSSDAGCQGKKLGDLCIKPGTPQQGGCSFDTPLNDKTGPNDPMACVCK